MQVHLAFLVLWSLKALGLSDPTLQATGRCAGLCGGAGVVAAGAFGVVVVRMFIYRC